MSKFLIFDALIIVLFILVSLLGILSHVRGGQVLLGFTFLNFVLAVLSYFNWPVLRGDVSDQSPLSSQDMAGGQDDASLAKPERPQRNFTLGLVGLGLIALFTGLLLILARSSQIF